jgi:AcrR family transcriptional regulator
MRKDTYHHGDLKNALIQAGIEILAEEGVSGLSLRKAASRAGVSHSAPYAHFSDKQALVAAISTAGYSLVHARLQANRERYSADPLRELLENAWVYIRFAVENPAHFKITFSSAVDKEADYPALVEVTRQTFIAVRQSIERCQAAGLLDPGLPDITTVAVWSQVHGLACLLLENQLSHTVLERVGTRELLVACLQQMVRAPIEFNIEYRTNT